MEEKFKLIEGTFNSKDTKEILLTLIEEKIKFHDVKSFSTEERTGKKNQESLLKIQELKETRAEIISFIDAEENGLNVFKINAYIDIERIKK
ncbi:hypothetical protein [Pedobacter arcticus]|uniref:hypothetical protein n=1 Tax=Pedobacter arcticus TaxID=752140 RepID=UPI000308DE79|nr:hypothetical protein [Pedobacter arcticus]